MTYKAIIFDFFGVIHADPYHAWLTNHGLVYEGQQASLVDAADLNQISMQDLYKGLGEITGQTATEVEAEQNAACVLNEETVELIRTLAAYYRIGLISNAPSEYIRGILEKYELTDIFDSLMLSGEVGFIKPAPQIFEIALERLGVSADEAIFIDDTPMNVTAATQLGLTGLVFADVSSLRQELTQLGILK